LVVRPFGRPPNARCAVVGGRLSKATARHDRPIIGDLSMRTFSLPRARAPTRRQAAFRWRTCLRRAPGRAG
jgi:hypothetical protein